jgi:hypothetical protein
MLPRCDSLRLRAKIQQAMMMASRRRAPTTEPTAIPAIAPPLSPDLDLAPGAEDPVADGDGEDVLEKMLPIVVVIGSFTLAQRVVVLEKRQHESVAFGELAAQ